MTQAKTKEERSNARVDDLFAAMTPKVKVAKQHRVKQKPRAAEHQVPDPAVQQSSRLGIGAVTADDGMGVLDSDDDGGGGAWDADDINDSELKAIEREAKRQAAALRRQQAEEKRAAAGGKSSKPH